MSGNFDYWIVTYTNGTVYDHMGGLSKNKAEAK